LAATIGRGQYCIALKHAGSGVSFTSLIHQHLSSRQAISDWD
jgi:hypothetical protein